ncbi:response regulator [Tabrizicola oligotrophica]|uniref:DNA-binding transcriptional regulator NtrC n=1 Tax=Tabrizicola oligotrophica TaxID=2710650 RepID=A0A6M0QP90_9RHOB|nr:response regulator [Tabrizicola oligotrophica]NEY88911.1 response regulator [Tabrizicola oligotrophica]
MDGTVLVADDDRTIRTVLTQALTRAGCKVHATSSLMTLMRWVEEGKGDLVISDVIMPDGNGLQALPQISRLRPGLPVIVISAQNTIMTAIQAAEAEAFDYLPKPFDLPDLMKRSARALERKRVAPKASPPREPAEELPLVGRTPVMQALYRLVARVVNVDLAVLITGESGTGKSLIARAIHDFSDRRAQPFVVAQAADLAGVDGISTLLTRARGGSLVLDEVSDYDEDAQARLVRMLDVMGDHGPRIMATSQADLAARMEAGSFRKDLYYRLAGVTLAVPALRERVDDIPLLAEHILARYERETGGPPRQLSQEAKAFVRAHAWPGNVRQLENSLRRLVVTSTEAEISRPEVEAALGQAQVSAAPKGGFDGEKLSQSIARHLQRYFDLHGGQLPPPGVYDRVLREMEIPLIEIALDATGGNQAKCADLLGINRNTLRKKITDLDIRVTRRRKLM